MILSILSVPKLLNANLYIAYFLHKFSKTLEICKRLSHYLPTPDNSL